MKKIKTIQFTEKEGLFNFSVKSTFLKVCKDPSSKDFEQLCDDYGMPKYLHNDNGPAVYYLDTLPTAVKFALRKLPETRDLKAYWQNGKLLKEKKRNQFINRLENHGNKTIKVWSWR